jgi:deoxycytidine triphosphate deaminase
VSGLISKLRTTRRRLHDNTRVPISNIADGDRRERARRQAAIANSKLSYAQSDEEAATKFRTWRERDPYPDVPPALLNNADIVDYVSRTGMIYPFYPAQLKPASYEIALLGKYLYADGSGHQYAGEIRKGEKFILKKNSIAFLSVEPYLRLPDYIALRHNLKITNVYQGLLVGTGPLVDPGFVGRLSLPLHNLTNTDYELTGGEGIIWVEFTKLSPNQAWGCESPRDGRKGTYAPFPLAKIELQEVNDYVYKAVGLGRVPSSSIADVALDARRAQRVAKRTRKLVVRFGIGGVLAGVAALLLALFQVVLPAIQLQQQTNTELRSQEVQIANLQQTLKELQASTRPASTRTP